MLSNPRSCEDNLRTSFFGMFICNLKEYLRSHSRILVTRSCPVSNHDVTMLVHSRTV